MISSQQVLRKPNGRYFPTQKEEIFPSPFLTSLLKYRQKPLAEQNQKNSWQWGVVDLYVHSETLTGPNVLLQVLVRT